MPAIDINICLSCFDLHYLHLNLCGTDCPTGYFEHASGVNECELCATGCVDCTDATAATCTTCKYDADSTTHYFFKTLSGCVVKAGCGLDHFASEVDHACRPCLAPCS